MRDEFTSRTISDVARAVSYRCSNPGCQRSTVGANAAQDGIINLGVAAHITAASPGGPRYNESIDAETRREKNNCIWLCQDCAKLIDSDPHHFTEKLLQEWKRTAQERTFRELLAPRRGTKNVEEELNRIEAELNAQGAADRQSFIAESQGLRQAALNDLAGFKRMASLPAYAVALNLRIHGDAKSVPFTIQKVPAAIEIAPEVCVVAPPGTGKTTTLLQLADEILKSEKAIPVFVRLGEWSTQNTTLMASLCGRRVFRDFGENAFRALADKGRLVLLLDGWNELDDGSRARLRAELAQLRREWPELRIIVSTRKQALDVPISGPKVEIDALSESQQSAIARGISGDTGEKLLDQSRRTPGVRSLILIPLYLTALLRGASGGALPTTKEAILGMFVREQERMAEHEEPLHADLRGRHPAFLTALAVEATRTGNTDISDSRACTVVTQAENALINNGQIATRLEPKTVLDVLVSHHTLIRTGSQDGALSFQHQQFEEWYASFEVEDAMWGSAAGDGEATRRLRVDILDQPAWEEAILFASERVSRMADGAAIVAHAVLLALAIDPMLAAEMIYRSDATVWQKAGESIQAFAQAWHRSGAADRAARFMVMTGRPEFAPAIWPLVTSEDQNVQFPALRNPPRFRPSVLGANIEGRIKALPERIRNNLLSSLVFEGGFDGIELATEIAKTDPSAEVQLAVIEALLFRRAEGRVAELLGAASNAVWPLLAKKGYADELADGLFVERLRAARQALIREETNSLRRASLIMSFGEASDVEEAALADAIASPDFPARDQNSSSLLHRGFRQFPGPIARGLLRRLEAGLELPFRAEDLLSGVPSVDDGPIVKTAIDIAADGRIAGAAARLVGPKTTGALIETYLGLNEAMHAAAGRGNVTLADQYNDVRHRINVTRASSFVPAILNRQELDDPRVIGLLAELIAQHGQDDDNWKKPLDVGPGELPRAISMIRAWVEKVIPKAKDRGYTLAEVASAIGRVGRVELLPDLKRLLDADLARVADEGAAQKRGQRSVRTLYNIQYRDAFARIDGDIIVPIVSEYLEKENFGFDAGFLLVEAWHRQANQPMPDPLKRWPNFENVAAARASKAAASAAASSPLSDRLFAAIESLAKPDKERNDQLLAIQLAKIGLSVPHGGKENIIDAVRSLPQPVRAKRELFAALAMDGEVLSADAVMEAVRSWIEETKQKPWMKDQNFFEVEGWLELLPFTDRPTELTTAIPEVIAAIGHERDMDRVVSALSYMPGEQGEQLLGDLARRHPKLASPYDWEYAILRRGTASASLLVIDLTSEGRLATHSGRIDVWSLSERMAPVVEELPGARAELIRRYQRSDGGPAGDLIAHILVKAGDVDGFMAVAQYYALKRRPFDGLLEMGLRNIALRMEPVDGWAGAFEYQPVAIAKLRKDLFAMAGGTPQEAAVAVGCLNMIDILRDEHGAAASEPRHPNIESGRAWPVITGERSV